MGYDQPFIEIRNSFGYGTSKHIFRNNIQISAPQVSRNISCRRFLQLRRVNIFFLFIWMRLFCHFVIDFLQSYINKPLKSKYHLFIFIDLFNQPINTDHNRISRKRIRLLLIVLISAIFKTHKTQASPKMHTTAFLHVRPASRHL